MENDPLHLLSQKKIPARVSYFQSHYHSRDLRSRRNNFMDKFARSKKWPYAALIVGIACIAWSAIFVRWNSMPGPASAFYRLLIPAIVLLPTWFFERDKTRMDAKSVVIIAIGGLFFALDL